jgi:1-acyl-sn-glycerol-3-phosphate acyltransferase
MEGFFLFIYNFFRNKRFLFLGLISIFLLIAIYLTSRLRFEEDITKMISSSGKQAEVLKAVEQSGILDRIIVNITPSDTTVTPEQEDMSAIAQKLADTLLTSEFKSYVRALTFRIPEDAVESSFDIINRNLPLFLEKEDYRDVESLTTPDKIHEVLGNSYRSLISPASFAMKKMILRDPVGLTGIASRKFASFQNDNNYQINDGCIFSKDGKHLLMFITTAYTSSATSKNSVFLKKLDKTIAFLENDSESKFRIEYFGSAAVAVGNADRLKKDIRLTLTLTIILLSLIITFSVKKKSLFPFIFLPAIVGGITALAVIYLIQAKISIISLSIGTVILAITVDYSLHITTHYKHRHSVIGTIRDVSFPIIVCGFATAFEFLSLVFVSSESLHELGILAAISVLTASFFTMVVMPHILDMTRSEKDETEEKNYLERILDKVTNYDFHKNKLLVLFMVVFTIIAWFFSGNVGFENDMMKMNYISKELARTEEDLDRINNYKLNSIYVIARGNNIEEALRNNEKLMMRGNELLGTNHIRSLNSPGSMLYSDSLQTAKINRWNDFWSDQKKAVYLRNFDAATSETGFKAGSFDGFRDLIEKQYAVLDTADFNQLRNQFYSNNINIAPGLATIVSEVKVDDSNKSFVEKELSKISGVVVLDRKSILSGMVDTLGKDFNLIANISMLLILFILILAFGRFELGFITFLPIFVSWIWTLGIMSMAGLKFNIFNIIISSFITGLGIDYSIYIMQGLVQGYMSENKNLLSFKTCILISVLISISGTGVLILAKHPALNSIALISIIGLLSVVLISYVFEPLLFNWLVTKKGKKRILPVTLTDLLVTVIALSAGLVLCIILNLVFFVVLCFPVKKKLKRRILHHILFAFMRVATFALANVRKKVVNESGEDFRKPSVILANHQSHLDLPLMLMLNPRIIVLTTTWVWNNPLYCLYIRYLGFYPVTDGYEQLTDKLREKVEEGYSILVFPEGTRSADAKIQRFHKGAFLLAEKLNLDIVPVLIHGASDCMNKGENHLRSGRVTIKILPRISADDVSIGTDYHQRTKSLLEIFRKRYSELKFELETPEYFLRKLVRNYVYKGPILEWYSRIKLSMEDNYSIIHRNVPLEASVVDIGCGYGMISYMLNFTSASRKILGIDYDEDKIIMANNCISKNDNVNFVAADAVSYDYPRSDVFILSDVLHYMPEEKQAMLISSCISNLNKGGSIIIRDADKDLKNRHLGTRYTEFFSTHFGFNKATENKLFFFSGKMIEEIAEKYKMVVEKTDRTKLTSNILYILRFRT